MRSRLDGEVKISQHPYGWAGGIVEMDGLEVNATLHFRDSLSLCGLGVDIRDRIEKSDDFRPRNMGLGNIGHVQEDIASLDAAKCNTLYEHVRTDNHREQRTAPSDR
jgi:hypothetical protein